MIDIGMQIQNIEKIMKLMEQYGIDEVSVDYLNIKKSRFKAPEPTPEELLEQHLKPKTLADAQAVAANRINEIEAWLDPEKK